VTDPKTRFPFAIYLAFVIAGFVLLSGCANRQLIDTPNLYSRTTLDPFQSCPPALRNNRVEVLYATDRLPVEQRRGGREYGYKRSKSLAYGNCVVGIGKDVPWPQLVENSLSTKRNASLELEIQSIGEMGRFPETPTPLVQQAGSLVPDPQAAVIEEEVAKGFRSEVARRLAMTPTKEAYVFIHGYNNTFEHSILVMVDLWHFLGRKGVPVAYSWPAGRGGLRGYNFDRESGEFTVFHLKQFIRLLASCPDLEKIHFLAHSRGTDVLSTAIRELVIEGRASGKDPRETFKIGDVVLAAADLDLEVVSQRLAAERVGLGLGRITIYVSSEDKALGFSNWLYSGVQRLGRVDFTTLDQNIKSRLETNRDLAVVDARVRSGFIGHSYFYSDPAVSSDLILLFGHGRGPGAENGRPLEPVGPNYWRIEKGYPNFQD
jgi:esterase/lipase superfamily enzyme